MEAPRHRHSHTHRLTWMHEGQRVARCFEHHGAELVEVPCAERATPEAPAPVTRERKPGCCNEGFLRKLAGGFKLAAQSFGLLGETPEPERHRRQAACLTCPFNDFGRCTDCGCFLWAKVRIASEACPQGKWTALTITVESKDAPLTHS